jgi:DNA-binding phage protein
MADTVDIQNLNLTMGELKALIMSINAEKKEDRRTTPPDMSELKKILEDAFKPFTEEIKANTKAVEGMKELAKAIKESNRSNKNKKNKTPAGGAGGTGEDAEKKAEAAAKKAEETEKRKRDAEKTTAQIKRRREAAETAHVVSSLDSLATMIDDTFAGVGNAHEKAFKGIIKEERNFVTSQKDIAYETMGALSTNKKLLSEYTILEKTSLKTGATREEFQKNLGNALRAGNRDLKIAKALTTAQLNTEKQLGLEAGDLSDTFQKLNTQYGMSEMQIGEMGRGMREVAKNSGLTGKELAKAVQSSTQFMEMMRNAGQLTSAAAKNIQSISASAQKFGIEKELGPLITAMSSSTDLMMTASTETKNFLFMSASAVGRTVELINGSILKTKQGTKDIAKGMRGVLKQFGVESLEAIENMTDEQKFRVNMSLKSAFGIEVDQAKREILALEEGSKTLSEKLADLNKEKSKNLNLEEKAIIAEKERSLKLSASFAVLTVLDEASKNAKNMGEAFSNFNAKASTYADELNVLGLTAASDKEVAKGAFVSAINSINQSLKAGGKKELKISSSEIENAINNPEAMRVLSAKLTSADQEASTAAKAQLDPARSMEQTLREYNDYFRTWSGAVLTLLGTSQIGNLITGLSTGFNVLTTLTSKGLNLTERFTSTRDAIKQKFFPEKDEATATAKKSTSGTTSGGMPPAQPPNVAETTTAKATETLAKEGTSNNSLSTHDHHAEKILNQILDNLKSMNQSINKLLANKSTQPQAAGKPDPMAALTQTKPTAADPMNLQPKTPAPTVAASTTAAAGKTDPMTASTQAKPATAQSFSQTSEEKLATAKRMEDKNWDPIAEKKIQQQQKADKMKAAGVTTTSPTTAPTVATTAAGTTPPPVAPSTVGKVDKEANDALKQRLEEKKAIREGRASKIPQAGEKESADKSLQRNQSNWEKRKIKEEKFAIKNQKRNTLDDKINNKREKFNAKEQGAMNKKEKGSMKSQGAPTIMGFDMSSLGGQSQEMMKAAPAIMMLGAAILLLGTALIFVGDKIISALGLDIGRIMEVGMIIAAIAAAGGAFILASVQMIESFSEINWENVDSKGPSLATQLYKSAPIILLLGLGIMALGAALIGLGGLILGMANINVGNIMQTSLVIVAVMAAGAGLLAGTMEVMEKFEKLQDLGDFRKKAWKFAKELTMTAPILLAISLGLLTLGAALVWASSKILSIMGLNTQTITETALTVATLIAALGTIALAVGLAMAALYGLGKGIEWLQKSGLLNEVIKTIAIGAVALVALVIPLLILSAVLMKFCSGILSILGVDSQKIEETVKTVSLLLWGLGEIAFGVMLAMAGLLALGAGAILLFTNPQALAVAVVLVLAGTAALFVLLPAMIYLASGILNFCSSILKSSKIDPSKIEETVQIVSTLFEGLGKISFYVGLAAASLVALGAGAAMLLFGGPTAGIVVGLIFLGIASLLILLPAMIMLASVLIDFCKSILKASSIDPNEIKKTVDSANALFSGLGDLIWGLSVAAMKLIAFGSQILGISVAFFIFLPMFTGLLKAISPNVEEFTKTLGDMLSRISKAMGGIGDVEYARRFAEEMEKTINAVVSMLQTLGVSIYKLAGKSFLGFGSSVIDDILYYSKGFSEAMKVICENVIKEGIIDPIVDNFNRSGVKKTMYAMKVAGLISKTVISISNMLLTFGDIVSKFSKKASWWRPLGNTVIEEIKDLGKSFSVHFKSIMKTINEGIITPIVEQFRNLKSVEHAGRASKALGSTVGGVADLLKNLSEKLVPLTQQQNTLIPFWKTNEIEKIESALAGLKEPLNRIFAVLINEIVPSITIGQNVTKKLQTVMPALDMFTKIVTFMGAMMDGMTKLQDKAPKKRDYSGSWTAWIPFVGMFTEGVTDVEKSTKDTGDMASVMTNIMNSLSSVIDVMEKASKANGKDSKRLENALKSFEQVSNITSKLSKIVEDYAKSSEVAKKIKSTKGGYDEATKSIKIVTEESSKLVVEIMKTLGTKQKFDEIRKATSLMNALAMFLGAILRLIENFSEITEAAQSLKKTMLKVGRENGAVIQEKDAKGNVIHETLNLDLLGGFIKLMFKSVIETSTSIFDILKEQKLPDVKGMMGELNKLMILIQAIRAIGFMMATLEQVYTAQESLNVQLGGGTITQDGKKVDRGNQVSQIATHMGDKIKSVVDLGSGIIQQIQGINIGNLKDVKTALANLNACVQAVYAVGMLMKLISGGQKGGGLLDIIDGLSDRLKETFKKSDTPPIKPNTIENIKENLDGKITPVIDLATGIIEYVGNKVKAISGDEAKKLMQIGFMMKVIQSIVGSLKELFLSKTEDVDTKGFFGAAKKKSNAIEEIAKSGDVFKTMFENIGVLVSGIVEAVSTTFPGADAIGQIKGKVVATHVIMRNIAKITTELCENIKQTYKAFRDTLPIQSSMQGEKPLEAIGKLIKERVVDDVNTNFPESEDSDAASDIIFHATESMKNIVLNFKELNKSVMDIMTEFYYNRKLYENLAEQQPLNFIGIKLWNHIVWELTKDTFFPKKADWDACVEVMESCCAAIIVLDTMLVSLKETCDLLLETSASFSELNENNSMKVIGDKLKENVIGPIFDYMPSEESINSSLSIIQPVITGIKSINEMLVSLRETCDLLTEVSGFSSELSESNPMKIIGDMIDQNVINPIFEFMPSEEKMNSALSRINLVASGITMISEALSLMKDSLEEISNIDLGNALSEMFSSFSDFNNISEIGNLNPVRITASGNALDVGEKLREEKATTEANTRPSSSSAEIISINTAQLTEQRKMVALLDEIKKELIKANKSKEDPEDDEPIREDDEPMVSGQQYNSESSNTSSESIGRKPSDYYAYKVGGFSQNAGMNTQQT